ncbi:MAG: hypothetical protein HY272_06660 [Gammaproteobacteria bacterium]|nr:hypothetical protein [Gammaproteobacteria bacterium]
MAENTVYQFAPDKKGAMWDSLLYVPTVLALASIALKLWFGPNQNLAYLLLFLASFFLIAGTNRILSSRLMLLPNAPRGLELGKKSAAVVLKSGERVELVKDLRYFPDYAGKSFGLTGMDLAGRKRQFVFHRGQFESESLFRDIRSLLAAYK